jgi:small conductance mechanosensitive channel
MENTEVWLNKGIEFIITFGPKIIGAILIYIVGSWVLKKVVRGIEHLMRKSKYEPTLQKFLLNLTGWGLKAILLIVVISILGIDITAFAAVIAAAGLAIGLSLQGSLGNFAGGVLIMIFKPYKLGDLIEAQGVIGHVKEIDIFTTKLITPENKLVIIPNGALANGNIANYTAEGKIRVDAVVGVGYSEDIKQAKKVLMNVLTQNPKVLKKPEPTVNVVELADSSVNFAVRPYCKPQDYWEVYFATYEGAKIALDKAGIEIPFPQRVLHQQ